MGEAGRRGGVEGMGGAAVDGGLRAFVAEALALKLKGRSENYNLIISQLGKRDELEALHRIFVALSSCVTTLTGHPEKFDGLFQALYKFEWPGDERVANALTGLVTLLVSVNSTFLHPTLKMLARGLSLKPLAVAAASPDPRHGSIHKALRLSLALVPAGQSELFPYLREAFPHRRNDATVLVNFARQLLLASEYLPALRDRVLGLIIERCLEIDVEIKIEDTGEACYQADEGEALVLSEHAMEDFFLLQQQQQEEEEQHGSQRLEATTQQQQEPAPAVDEMADKLDGLMLLLFEYLDTQIRQDPSGSDSSQRVRRVLLEGLLPTLESSILPTHRCKYVQFLVFYLTTGHHHHHQQQGGEEEEEEAGQHHPRSHNHVTSSNSNAAAAAAAGVVAMRLVDHLCGLVRSEATPPVLRQSAAAYVASFLARSRSLSCEQVVGVLLSLVRDLQGYVQHEVVKEQHERRWRRRRGSRGSSEDEDDEGAEQHEGVGIGGAGSKLHHHHHRNQQHQHQQHLVFYSVCQAVLYVVAFHHSTVGGLDLLGLAANHATTTATPAAAAAGGGDQQRLEQQQEELRWRLAALAHCHLRPLYRCLESVRREFLRLAARHHLLQRAVLADLLGGHHHHHHRCNHHHHHHHHHQQDNNDPASAATQLQPQDDDENDVPPPPPPPPPPSTTTLQGASSSCCAQCSVPPPSKAGVGGGGGHCTTPSAANPLDSYFPFDPYILRRSSKYVATPHVYRYWQATQEFQDDHDDDDDEAADDDAASMESLAGSSSSSSSYTSSSEGEEEEDDDDDDERGSTTAMSLDSRCGHPHLMRRGRSDKEEECKAAARTSSSRRRRSSRGRGRGEGGEPRDRVESLDLTGEDDEYMMTMMMPEAGREGDHMNGKAGQDLLPLPWAPATTTTTTTTTTRVSSSGRGRGGEKATTRAAVTSSSSSVVMQVVVVGQGEEDRRGGRGRTTTTMNSSDDDDDDEDEDAGEWRGEEEDDDWRAADGDDDEEDEEVRTTEKRARALSVESVGSW